MDIKTFQRRYGLTNKAMAKVCQCSLPTIQKWRSGEVRAAGPAIQLMRVLDRSAQGDPERLHELMASLDRPVKGKARGRENELDGLESGMSKAVERLELMLEARRKDRQLAESEARYRAILESHTEPVCRWLPDTTLTFANEAYGELFSRPGEDLSGRKWIEFVPEEKRSMVMTVVSDIIRQGEPENYAHESIDRDGTIRHFKWRNVPIKNEHGIVTELHSMGHEVTEIIGLKQEVAELKRMRSTLMSLCDHPFMIFDETGRILESNEGLKEAVGTAASGKRLADIAPGLPMGRFRQLLKRLGATDQIRYRIRMREAAWVMRIRRLIGNASGQRYLAVFEEEVPSLKVMKTRLEREVIINGEHVDFLLDPKSRKAVDKEMQDLGSSMGVDRIYLFTIDHENGLFDNVLEWCAAGVEAHIDELKRIPMEDYSWWMKRLLNGQWIKLDDVGKLPRTAAIEKEVLIAQGIRSILVAPVTVGESVMGFVGFDQTSHLRVWHGQETKALEAFRDRIAGVLGEAIGKTPKTRSPR